MAILQQMTLPYAWRITKYNPALRNSQGHYLAEEWTFFAEIGKTYSGQKLTYQHYLSVENLYVASVIGFLSDAGLSSLRVTELENHRLAHIKFNQLRDIASSPSLIKLGSIVNTDLEDVVRMNLREVLWCQLTETSRFYLHFGWDYYMYIGSAAPSLAAIKNAERSGLFVEEMVSPYLK